MLARRLVSDVFCAVCYGLRCIAARSSMDDAAWSFDRRGGAESDTRLTTVCAGALPTYYYNRRSSKTLQYVQYTRVTLVG